MSEEMGFYGVVNHGPAMVSNEIVLTKRWHWIASIGAWMTIRANGMRARRHFNSLKWKRDEYEIFLLHFIPLCALFFISSLPSVRQRIHWNRTNGSKVERRSINLETGMRLSNNLQIRSKLHIKRIKYYNDHKEWQRSAAGRHPATEWNALLLDQVKRMKAKHGNWQKHNAINGCGSAKRTKWLPPLRSLNIVQCSGFLSAFSHFVTFIRSISPSTSCAAATSSHSPSRTCRLSPCALPHWIRHIAGNYHRNELECYTKGMDGI